MPQTASAELARLSRALGYDTRFDILRLLQHGDATVSDLAERLALDQPRVSSHLAALREVGLVLVHAAGRQRVYHVDAERLEPLLASLAGVAGAANGKSEAPGRSPQAARLVRDDAPLRQARTCYDHLAGVAGVQLMDGMLERNWLVPELRGRRTVYTMSSDGESEMRGRGVDLQAARRARRQFAFACIDWTERRPHLGGALGAAVLGALTSAGVAGRPEATPGRGMVLAKPIAEWLERPD